MTTFAPARIQTDSVPIWAQIGFRVHWNFSIRTDADCYSYQFGIAYQSVPVWIRSSIGPV